jgi:hypothetical protein
MKIKILLLLFTFPTSLFCQGESAVETLFENKKYDQARKLYENLLKQKPNPKQKVIEGLYNYQLARCCYELKEAECAITNFELARTKFPQSDQYLGELYFDCYHFEESAKSYQNFLTTLKEDDPQLAIYKVKAKKSEMAADLLTKVNDIAIVDSLVVNKTDFLKFYKYSKELGTLTQTPLQLNPTQQFDRVNYLTQRGDRVCFSDTLHGQMDIFTSYKLIDKWTKADMISSNINTAANENYPFFMLDGLTLYFSSDGENSIGGYDIFMTRYSSVSKNYLLPENIGMPFNSPFNDYMMVIDEQRKLGWFASDRYQPEGKVAIYTFIPNETKIIVHCEQPDTLRGLAALKIYRKAEKMMVDSAKNTINNVEKTNIDFIVNDSTVYTNTMQFKCEASLNIWLTYKKNAEKLDAIILELSNLRAQYENMEKAADRKELTLKIIELEKKKAEMDKLLKSIALEVRNTENEFIRKKKVASPQKSVDSKQVDK